MRKPISVLAVILALSFLSACQPPVETTPTPGPTYSVTYIGNGNTTGRAPVDPTDYQEGQTVTVASMSAHGPLTANFFFAWNTQADGSGTYYFPNDTFTMETLNVTLYATWKEFHYYHNGDGLTVCGYMGPDTEVIIPSSCEGYPVTAIGNTGDSRDFSHEAWLTGVTIPTSVKSISGGAFEGAFDGCYGLISINIPESVESIGTFSFRGCSGLNSPLTIPASVKSIGRWAFSGCVNLPSVTISSGVESIDTQAFHRCKKLSTIDIPATVTTLGPVPFVYCASLPEINVDPDNPNYKSENGVLFDKSGATLLEMPCGLTGEYSIPSTVTDISPYAFVGSNLKGVTIPTSVTTIGDEAFVDCSLESIEIPGSVTTLGWYAFSSCEKLAKVELKEGITTIGDIFVFCSSLANVTLPSSITTISDGAFFNLTALTDVYVLATEPPEIFSSTFSGCPAGMQIHVPTADLVPVYQAAAEWSNLLIVYP